MENTTIICEPQEFDKKFIELKEKLKKEAIIKHGIDGGTSIIHSVQHDGNNHYIQHYAMWVDNDDDWD